MKESKEEHSKGIFQHMIDNAPEPVSMVSYKNADELYEAFKEAVESIPDTPRETQMPGEFLLGLDDDMFKSYWNHPPKNIRYICGHNTYQALIKRAKELGLSEN